MTISLNTNQIKEFLTKYYLPQLLKKREIRLFLSLNKGKYPRFHVIATRNQESWYVDVHIDWEEHRKSTGSHPLITKLIRRLEAIDPN